MWNQALLGRFRRRLPTSKSYVDTTPRYIFAPCSACGWLKRICLGRCCPIMTPVLCLSFIRSLPFIETVPWQVSFAG